MVCPFHSKCKHILSRHDDKAIELIGKTLKQWLLSKQHRIHDYSYAFLLARLSERSIPGRKYDRENSVFVTPATESNQSAPNVVILEVLTN